MTWTMDLVTKNGEVRLLIPDRVESEAIFSDEQIAVFLRLESNDTRRATAMALETIATDQALVLKVIKIGKLSTDGQKTAQALLDRAAILRQQANLVAAVDASGDPYADFDWAHIGAPCVGP